MNNTSLADLLRSATSEQLSDARLLLGGQVYSLDKWELVKGSCDREEFRSVWHPLSVPGLLTEGISFRLANFPQLTPVELEDLA